MQHSGWGGSGAQPPPAPLRPPAHGAVPLPLLSPPGVLAYRDLVPLAEVGGTYALPGHVVVYVHDFAALHTHAQVAHKAGSHAGPRRGPCSERLGVGYLGRGLVRPAARHPSRSVPGIETEHPERNSIPHTYFLHMNQMHTVRPVGHGAAAVPAPLPLRFHATVRFLASCWRLTAPPLIAPAKKTHVPRGPGSACQTSPSPQSASGRAGNAAGCTPRTCPPSGRSWTRRRAPIARREAAFPVPPACGFADDLPAVVVEGEKGREQAPALVVRDVAGPGHRVRVVDIVDAPPAARRFGRPSTSFFFTPAPRPRRPRWQPPNRPY